MGVKLAAASGGSIELVPTNTASNFTVTVPAATGTMLTTATAGTVLQVVSSAFSTGTSSTSTAYVDSTVSLGITLASASNKVLMLFNGGFGYVATGYPNGLVETICRQSSATYSSGNDLTGGAAFGMTQIYNSTNLNTVPHSLSYLDTTPGSTTPTYRIFYKVRAGGSNVTFCEPGTQMSFTLLEIAA